MKLVGKDIIYNHQLFIVCLQRTDTRWGDAVWQFEFQAWQGIGKVLSLKFITRLSLTGRELPNKSSHPELFGVDWYEQLESWKHPLTKSPRHWA